MGPCISKKNKHQDKTDELDEESDIKINDSARQKLRNKKEPRESLIIPPSDQSTHDNSHQCYKRRDLSLLSQRYIFRGASITKRHQGFEEKGMKLDESQIDPTFLESIGIWVTCKKGLKTEDPNQDNFCIIIDGSNFLLGVFDGHGEYGHSISEFLSVFLLQSALSNPLWQSDPLSSLKESFLTSQSLLIQESSSETPNFDCKFSGSTAVTVCVKQNHLYISHVGDSRAVLAKKQLQGYLAVPLTNDHKPNFPDEKKRIENFGGEVKQMWGEKFWRVFFPGKEFPGLAMSRSIGDLASQPAGVISEPEIQEVELEENDDFLVICSDGIWEFITDQEAVDLVAKSGYPKQAAEKLAALGWMRWLLSGTNTADDMTIIVAYIPKLS